MEIERGWRERVSKELGGLHLFLSPSQSQKYNSSNAGFHFYITYSISIYIALVFYLFEEDLQHKNQEVCRQTLVLHIIPRTV